MSWQAWTEDGYGYPLFNEHNIRKVFDFIAENSEYKEIKDCETSYDAYDIMGQCCADTVAEIINEREQYNIFRGYNSCGDTNQEEYIGVEPCYPWEMHQSDYDMTKEEANRILCEYAEVLGVEEAPDYFEAHYCG